MSSPVPETESLSIGEMLDQLKVEFPDVTISKIRFLESQGLLDPERTASGYRKFYPADVERLRWILRQQRENFLPLKVIKGRLEAEGNVLAGTAGGDQNQASPELGAPGEDPAASPPDDRGGEPEPEAADVPPPAGRAETTPAETTAAQPTPAQPEGPRTFTRDELARASGLSPSELSQLERHGLVAGSSIGSQLYYDSEALEVARLAAAFARHGVEPRHLRMYKNSAEREAGFYEQIVLPLLKQRNPAARQQALDTLDALSGLGDELRRALRRQALGEVGQERPPPRRS